MISIGKFFNDEIKINQYQFDGCTWCRARDGEAQLQAHHASQQFNMEMVQFILWVCMISCGMDYMCKIKGEDNMSFAS